MTNSSRSFGALSLLGVVCVLPVLAGKVRNAAADPTDVPLALTPAPLALTTAPPSQLIFCNYDHIFTVLPDGSGRRTLANRQFVASPSLSSDGKRYAYDFYRDDLGIAETIIASTDGKERPLVVARQTKDAKYLFPVISPDGRSVIVQKRRFSAKGDITYSERLMLFTEEGKQREMGPDTLFAYSYRFARDGRSVLFAKSRSKGLFRISVMGGHARAAQHLPIPREVWEFDIAPDGRCLVFTSAEKGEMRGFYVCTIEGAELHRLPLPPAKYRSPTWSPDGKYIAFTYDWDANPPGIRIVDADGRNKRILTRDEANAGPIWR